MNGQINRKFINTDLVGVAEIDPLKFLVDTQP